MIIGFNKRSIKGERLVGKVLMNYQLFVKFIKFFHHQIFVPYAIWVLGKGNRMEYVAFNKSRLIFAPL